MESLPIDNNPSTPYGVDPGAKSELPNRGERFDPAAPGSHPTRTVATDGSVTLYRVAHNSWTYVRHEPGNRAVIDGECRIVGEFICRPWCKTHDLPVINQEGTCSVWGADEFGLDCESVDIWVQVIPDG
jgi:hypothetical protein